MASKPNLGINKNRPTLSVGGFVEIYTPAQTRTVLFGSGGRRSVH
jgi:hypothetical protein